MEKVNIKQDFAKWLLNNAPESYNYYLGGSTNSIKERLNEISNFFPDQNFFQVDPSEVDQLIQKVKFIFSTKERRKKPDFLEYDKHHSNGIPKAIMGKNNYLKFLKEKFSDDKTLNYWLFQGNPKVFDFKSALAENTLDNFTVSAHKDKIKKGDKVIIWLSGDKPGCYALAEITNSPRTVELSADDKHWKKEKPTSVKTGVEITHNCYYNPILWEAIKDLPEFENLNAGHQGTNFKATKVEYDKLLNLSQFKLAAFQKKQLNNLLVKYYQALIENDRLQDELYKFEWAEWLNEQVDFKQQSDESILQLCLKSQQQSYTSSSSGVQFIKQGAREKLSKYIGIEDIKIFREYDNKRTLKKLNCKSRNMSYPILSCWLSALFPSEVFPSSKTAFSDIVRSLFSVELSNSKMDFVTGMQVPMKTISLAIQKRADIIKHCSVKLEKSNLTQLDFNWLTQDFLLFLDRNPEILLQENSEIKTQNIVMNNSSKPLNQILFGPPGTGKTYKLQSDYFEQYTKYENRTSKEDYLVNKMEALVWWQVLFIALLDLGTVGVNSIISHPAVKAKAKSTSIKNLQASIWGALQRHTKDDCEHVNVKSRAAIKPFWKTEDSKWHLYSQDEVDLFPEAQAILDKYKNYESSSGQEIKNFTFVTFHQSFTYEDFVEGIKPVLEDENEDLRYEICDGVFKKLALKAHNDPDNNYAIFIDEINRGNVASIFGELITLIEKDKRAGAKNQLSVILPYSKTEFSVPSNLHIIGTMNTADRSIEALDSALRRRFEFEEVMPDYQVIDENLNNLAFEGYKVSNILKTINDRITVLINRDHQIGHSYFLNLKKESLEQDLKNVFMNKIIPLLQEYFFNDYIKIAMVLGEGFMDKGRYSNVKFATNDGDFDSDYSDMIIYEIKKDVNISETIKLLMGHQNEN